jgi:hypothetical protein
MASRKEEAMRHNDPMGLNNRPAITAKYGKTSIRSHHRFLFAASIFAIVGFLLPPAIASAGNTHEKRPLNRAGHGYGFLPGYEPPDVVDWRRAISRRPTFWYGGPGFYRGRWNGGGFGPCWTPTPIGPHWNCG